MIYNRFINTMGEHSRMCFSLNRRVIQWISYLPVRCATAKFLEGEEYFSFILSCNSPYKGRSCSSCEQDFNSVWWKSSICHSKERNKDECGLTCILVRFKTLFNGWGWSYCVCNTIRSKLMINVFSKGSSARSPIFLISQWRGEFFKCNKQVFTLSKWTCLNYW